MCGKSDAQTGTFDDPGGLAGVHDCVRTNVLELIPFEKIFCRQAESMNPTSFGVVILSNVTNCAEKVDQRISSFQLGADSEVTLFVKGHYVK